MKQPPDMSRAAFKAALVRNGFRQVLLWGEDTTGMTPGVSYGMVMNHKGKILRRASLAYMLRRRAEEATKRENIA
ncbi:MAG TPA: hypothetical protein VNM70_11610 [Burkholderiales bacterium]|jgi:hypothetical protein|nr:hypothetical protein [Burkholderiales bacterium]